MDEPTSAIDPIAEAGILRNFVKIAQGKTAVIVSHRTGLCPLVDKIAVMKAGQIMEFGTHEALLREGANMQNCSMPSGSGMSDASGKT
jgi:ATP-binding cassette subfamily B protein